MKPPNEFGIAIDFHQRGLLADADFLYRQILQREPQNPDALHLLGVVKYQMGELAIANAMISEAILLRPDHAAFHCNLGLILRNQGDLEAAYAAFNRAIALQPIYPEAFHNLGIVLDDRGDFHAAAIAHQQAIHLRPDYTDAYSHLGFALDKLGITEQAVQVFLRLSQIQANHADTFYNLGLLYERLGHWQAAIQSLLKAVALRPEHAETFYALGHAFQSSGQDVAAIDAMERAIRIRPEYSEACADLGAIYMLRGEHELAIENYRKAYRWNPESAKIAVYYAHQLQQCCDWREADGVSRKAIANVEKSFLDDSSDFASPFYWMTLPIPTTLEQQFRCARKRVQVTSGKSNPDRARHSAVPVEKKQLTLGYLSADFRNHPVAWLTAELFEVYDQSRFRVIGYSYGPENDDPIRNRIAKGVGLFRDIRSIGFREAANRIASDGVDILIDLTGYTGKARPQILAHRPAPIQVNYLGYPGTMGADFIDYMIVDHFIAPCEHQPYYAEQLVHLPGCYQVNDSQRSISKVLPSRRECSLPEDAFVFCSFNNTYKITSAMFDVWMRLLRANPNSVLWLLEPSLLAKRHLQLEAIKRDVSSERLVFAAKLPMPEHLARHRLADLFLDTFPVNAHTTASDALQMGLPLITLAGETMIARVAGSLLHSVGMSELVTHRLSDYERLSCSLAQNPSALSEIRHRLAQNIVQSDLFSGQAFARKIEKAYEAMWKRYLSGLAPCPIKVE
ncbi:MAG: tetratricopeptide repeat protein [Pirellulaceae bacterium]|nr:tetratricopeptide repeat protein [Pirellulaceae bacterium]